MDTRNVLGIMAICLSATSCNWLHSGPSAGEIDAAVRRALDSSNQGGVNALIGNPLPTSADVASVKPDGDCVKSSSEPAATYHCSVSISLRAATGKAGSETLHADLLFAKDSAGKWKTSDIDRAITVGAAKSLIDQVNQSLPGRTASQPR